MSIESASGYRAIKKGSSVVFVFFVLLALGMGESSGLSVWCGSWQAGLCFK